jgi:hypothetical protein
MKTHRELYPEQYAHPLCGRKVTAAGVAGVVDRVVPSRFGPLAILVGDGKTAYALGDVQITERK